MSDDALASIDAAVAEARQDECACGCDVALTDASPSLYFASEACATSYRRQQAAVADGDTERAEEMRRQRREDPVERMHRQADERWSTALRERPDAPERAPGELAMTVEQAVSMLGDGDLADALRMESDNPLAYLPPCAGCARRDAPDILVVQGFGCERPLRTWRRCPHCGGTMPPADLSATVRRRLTSGGLQLALRYGDDTVLMLLAPDSLSRYASLDRPWRELETMLSLAVRLPWDYPLSDVLADVQQEAIRVAEEGQGRVFWAPLDEGGRPSRDGWVEVGYTSDEGLVVDESRGWHGREGASMDATVRSRHRIPQSIAVSVRLAAEQMRRLVALMSGMTDAFAAQRAIDAKRNRQHGPQRTQRAPRRIDPTRRR
ncbi:hypothetical protein [Micromonospora sp. NPDC047730]|uniref:hypothetical protein n=1 Tax=Micromonospora sp. NPDC047730 TaxID=3364253 RepID=UPI00371083D4